MVKREFSKSALNEAMNILSYIVWCFKVELKINPFSRSFKNKLKVLCSLLNGFLLRQNPACFQVFIPPDAQMCHWLQQLSVRLSACFTHPTIETIRVLWYTQQPDICIKDFPIPFLSFYFLATLRCYISVTSWLTLVIVAFTVLC